MGNPLTPQNDVLTALTCESVRNGSEINWAYWTHVEPNASQAARLAHFIDPIKWPGHVYEQGRIPHDLLEKIGRLQLWLEQVWPFPTITLGHLVRHLGDDAGATLRAAAEPELAALRAQSEAAVVQEKERRAAGRFFLEEVADALAGEVEYDRWLHVIVAAVKNGELSLRNPQNYRDNIPYPVPVPLRTWYDQVHFQDVNRWLDRHPDWTEIRLNNEEVDGSAVSSAAATPGRRGLTKQQILVADWPVNINLRGALTDIGHHKWLRTARVTEGRVGGRSALWDPVQIGVCLCTSNRAATPDVARHIAKHFPEWLSDWEERSEFLGK